MIKTYINRKPGIRNLISELIYLYQFQSQNQTNRVQDLVDNMSEMEKSIEMVLGSKVRDKRILEIGPGQTMPHLYYFARSNKYLGIDLDQPVLDLSIRSILNMWRANGLTRVIKTLGRRVVGIDRAFKQEICRQLAIKEKPEARLMQMDATDIKFEDNSFDIVFSVSVFEHIPDPRIVALEIARVLKPGGVSYIVTHPYTSDSGIHDPRVFGERDDIPYWSHLRPEYENLVRRNCYLNEIRLEQYKSMFIENWPGCGLHNVNNTEKAQEELQKIRKAGGLNDFSDEELITDALIAIWKKP